MVTTAVLDAPVLELNKCWQPINVVDVRRALSMMMAGLARAIEPEDYTLHDFNSWADLRALEGEPVIHTVSLALRLPEVIVLNKYDRMPRKKVIFSRRNVHRRDRNACQYCGLHPGTEELTIDHVMPKSRGGHSSWINCVSACVPCNAKKSNRTPLGAGMRLIRQPIEPKWTQSMTLARFKVKSSWEKFVSSVYWNVELDQD